MPILRAYFRSTLMPIKVKTAFLTFTFCRFTNRVNGFNRLWSRDGRTGFHSLIFLSSYCLKILSVYIIMYRGSGISDLTISFNRIIFLNNNSCICIFADIMFAIIFFFCFKTLLLYQFKFQPSFTS